MTLSEVLQSKFRGDVRFRGAAYVQAERVAITSITPERVFAVVRNGTDFETQLLRKDDQLHMFCSCSEGGPPDITCKHLWATILTVDEGRFLTGTPTAGYFPPFVAESGPINFNDDEWEDGTGGDVFHPSSSRRTAQAIAEAPVPMREWESRLQTLRESMDVGETASTTAPRDREISYEIDVEDSRRERKLVVELSQRQRRNNGQWGKLKPLRLRPGQLDDIEHEDDRRILAYLSGGSPERSNWYTQQAELQAAVFRFRVPFELCALLLPMMCQTGHVRFKAPDEPSERSLTWDDGPAWELSLCLTADADNEQWTLEGRLHRGDEVLKLTDAQLIVPGGLVCHDDRIARLEEFGDCDWVDLLLRDEPLTVPNGEEQELVDRLLDMPALPRLELPKELQLEEIHADAQPHLTVHAPGSARWQRERLRGEVHFDYLGTMVRGSSQQAAIVQRDQGRCIMRSREQEDRAWSQLQAAGFRRLLDRRKGGHDIEITARDLGSAVRSVINDGWQVRAEGKQVRQPGELHFRVESGIDWFELHADIDFAGHSVAFPELLSALSRGDSTVRLDDGSLGIVPEEWARQYGLLAGLGVSDDGHVRFAANQVALLDALLATQESVDYDAKFSELRDTLNSFDGIAEVTEPKGFHGDLRTYQREGLGWLEFLQKFHFGGCLADDMGLGKTVQLLALLQDFYRDKRRKLAPSLIVVPKSLLFNWMQECHRFTPDLKAMEYTGIDRAALRDDFKDHHIILTTYGTLRRDTLELKEIPFEYAVLDEAQTIKNAASQVAKSARLIKANHRLALSGTPIENHLGDLWSIFEFLNPGMLGRSSLFKTFTTDAESPESRELLAKGLTPFILRRTKKQVASELPEKMEETIHCKMGKDQRRLYLEMRDHYRDSLLGLVEKQGLAKSKIHVLEALLRLRQAACHPALLDKTSFDAPSAKLDVLCPYLEELVDEGHKTLVFSQFTSMLSIVKRHLDKRNIVYEYLDGQTRDRQAAVERFQNDPDCGVFLISLKAGGLGLNLTAADYVFLLDPWWNPAVETQAIDRAHRVGQTRQVFAYRLICQDTVEEKIAALQSKKRSLANAILQENASLIKDISTDDLHMLLS